MLVPRVLFKGAGPHYLTRSGRSAGSAKDEKIAASAPSTPVLFLKPTTSYLPMGSSACPFALESPASG